MFSVTCFVVCTARKHYLPFFGLPRKVLGSDVSSTVFSRYGGLKPRSQACSEGQLLFKTGAVNSVK